MCNRPNCQSYIQNSTFDAVDLSDFEHSGSVFVSVFIPGSALATDIASTAVDADLDGFTLRIGSSSTVYFSKAVTTTNENLAFHAGWNLLRFDFNSATETGTVDMDNIDYVRLAVDRGATGIMATTDWRVDYIVARRGKPHELWFYSRYPWQSSAGTYIEESTAATDLLNVESTLEYELMVLKGKELVALDLEKFDEMKIYQQLYEDAKARYQLQYSSERLLLIQNYHSFQADPQEGWLD